MTQIDGGLRAEFRERIPEFQWTSVETGGTSSGVPDSEFCHDASQAWLEFKKTDTTAVELRVMQISWMERRARAGGRVLVGVRRTHSGGPRRGPAIDQLWLLDGRTPGAIKKFGLTTKFSYFLGMWDGGPDQWDWRAVRRILLGN